MNKKTLLRSLIVITALFFALSVAQTTPPYTFVAGKAEMDSSAVVVKEWLMLGPIATPLPAYNTEGAKKIESTDLLKTEFMDISGCKPAAGEKVNTPTGELTQWTKRETENGTIKFEFKKGTVQTLYLASYIDAPRWLKVKVACESTLPFSVFIDGTKTIESLAPQKDKNSESKEISIEQGSHTLIVKVIYSPSDTTEGNNFTLNLESAAGKSLPIASTNLERYLSLSDILNLPRVSGVDISPDGKLIALTMSIQPKKRDNPERWLEIRRTSDGKLLASIKGIKGLHNVKWTPVGRKLSYIVSDKDKATINLYDFESGRTTTIIENIKNLNNYVWSPKGNFIVYSITEKPKEKNKNVKRLRSISDRWSYGRMRSYLYIASVPRGLTRRLTAGKYSTSLLNVKPNGKAILFTRTYEELSERPYDITELVEMNLENDKIDLLWKGHWLNNAQYSPKGDKLLIIAGPSAFGDKGKNVPKGVIPNDYDGQGYIFDIKSRRVTAFTNYFNPSISRGVWSKVDNNIYLVAEDSSFVRLFRYETARKRFKKMMTGCDVLGWSGDISKTKPIAVLTGSSANKHVRLYLIDLKRNRSRVLLDQNSKTFSHIKMGKVENWDFTSSAGRLIKGRIHYPPDFDPRKSYPCIVYYYGGTEPVSRDFGGRYPKNLWSAMGYVVYVLQPSGATGFGQSFSALHVNDWGKIVAGEIIEGTKKFFDDHPFVDRKHVGCIGASYGGFMTQLLLTKTNIFAAAVSHAGINLISHYWGEGYWGYAYNAVSAANSFPWNKKDIYIDQSPLFYADKITTPLLLLHGTADTNVPTGESDQMYTALKLLGKTVEYVQIKGQNHLITDYKRRVAWSNTICAWFDKWLKGEPEWWYALYPDSKTEQSKAQSNTNPCSEIPSSIEGLKPQKVTASGMEPILVGNVTRENIKETIPNWDDEYYNYEPDKTVLSALPTYISNDITITCILGTWCSDSMREVPRFWKVMEYAGLPAENLKMLAVDHFRAKPSKDRPANLIDWSKKVRKYFGIRAVPTFIVCSGGKELGRIIEKPKKSLEEDLLEILKKK